MIDWVAVGAIATPLVSLAAIVTQNRREHREVTTKLDDVKAEVVTGNAAKLGEQVADNETRRIVAIPKGKRTAAESQHLKDVPPLS